MKSCRHFFVSGFVQGVFYRASTQDVARRLGLTGWVRNLPNGDVEVVACGEPAKLAELERWLWDGPPAAQVASVTARDVPVQSFADFGLRR